MSNFRHTLIFIYLFTYLFALFSVSNMNVTTTKPIPLDMINALPVAVTVATRIDDLAAVSGKAGVAAARGMMRARLETMISN